MKGIIMQERAFWVKWNNLNELHEVLRDTALSMMIQADAYSDNIKKRSEILDIMVKDIIRNALGVSCLYRDQVVYDPFRELYLGEGEDAFPTPNIRKLQDSLRGLWGIAYLYFNIFKAMEEPQDEDLNFSNFI